MSGIVSSFGVVFNNETRNTSSSVTGAILSETSGVTNTQVTQASFEQWMNANVNAQITQVAIEEWGLTGTVGTQAITTQVAIEEWASTGSAPPPVVRKASVWVQA